MHLRKLNFLYLFNDYRPFCVFERNVVILKCWYTYYFHPRSWSNIASMFVKITTSFRNVCAARASASFRIGDVPISRNIWTYTKGYWNSWSFNQYPNKSFRIGYFTSVFSLCVCGRCNVCQFCYIFLILVLDKIFVWGRIFMEPLATQGFRMTDFYLVPAFH